MALLDRLQELQGSGPAKRNRVAILLDKLDAENPEDAAALREALNNRSVRHAAITAALKYEYGDKAVTDTSVREYRINMGRQVNGL